MTFSSKSYLERKTGRHGQGRFEYLQTLVTEFQDTDKQGSYYVIRVWSVISYKNIYVCISVIDCIHAHVPTKITRRLEIYIYFF